jgi:hypothetical protein
MSDAPSPLTDADQRSASSSEDAHGSPSGRPEGVAGADAVVTLAADLRDLQTRYDELLRRFLEQVEQRQALDKALYAERLKSAGLQRDLGVFQRQWQIAQKEWHATQTQWRAAEARWLTTQAELQQTLHEMRHSRVWKIGQTYWNVTRKLKGR